MTSNQLRDLLNKEFGIDKWPSYYEVDADTYANVCQTLFQDGVNKAEHWNNYCWIIPVYVGNYNNGIMFKNVELILKT